MESTELKQESAPRDTMEAYRQLTDEDSRTAFRGRIRKAIVNKARNVIPGYDDDAGERRILEWNIFGTTGESLAVGSDDIPPIRDDFWQRFVERHNARTAEPPVIEGAATVDESVENSGTAGVSHLDAPVRTAVPVDRDPPEPDIAETALKRSIEAYRTAMDEDERAAFCDYVLGALSPTRAVMAKDYGRDAGERKVFEKIICDVTIEALDSWPTDDPDPWADFALQLALTRIRPAIQPGGRAVPRSGRHATTPDLLAAFPGEDRSFGGNQLFVDLIPARCWFTSAAQCLVASDWDRIRHQVYERRESSTGRNKMCEICGATGNGGALEVHERWAYDEATGVQRLVRLITLCWLCHRTTHYGRTQLQGLKTAERARKHLCRVNGWYWAESDAYIDAAYTIWEERYERDWDLDLSILEAVGARFERSVVTDERAEVAHDQLRWRGVDPGVVQALDRPPREPARSSAADGTVASLERATAGSSGTWGKPPGSLPVCRPEWRWSWWRLARGVATSGRRSSTPVPSRPSTLRRARRSLPVEDRRQNALGLTRGTGLVGGGPQP